MKNTRSLRSQALDLLRFPLAVIVVIVHLFTLEDIALPNVVYKVSEYPMFVYVNVLVGAFLRGISVPIYFFISGYVFFFNASFTIDIYKKKLQNRIKTLLIPYIIWNAVALLLVIFKELPLFESLLSHRFSGVDLSLRNVLSCFWFYDGALNPINIADGNMGNSYFPLNYPLWYLRDLMIIILTVPLIYWLVKRLKEFSLLLLFALYIASLMLHWSDRLFCGYFFFSWGAYMSIHGVDMIDTFKKYFKQSLFLYLFNCTLCVLFVNQSTIFQYIKIANSVIAVVAFFNIAVWLLQSQKVKINALLAKSSFFIYVTHYLILDRCKKVLFMIVYPDSGLGVLFVYCMTLVTVVTVLLSVFYLLKRYSPSVLSVVAGYKP